VLPRRRQFLTELPPFFLAASSQSGGNATWSRLAAYLAKRLLNQEGV
jgi:hypothetical protein